MTDVRSQAIALLVEKLREIEAEADQTCKQENAWLAKTDERGVWTSAEEILQHCDTRDLNYALAYRCEQLIEEITGALLFDELDAQDAAAEEAAHEAERHHGTWGPNGEDYIPEDGPEVHALPGLDGVYGDGEP